MLRLESDLLDLLEGSAEGNLNDVVCQWSDQPSACVVLASQGYPGHYETGKTIDGLKRAKTKGVEIFHAGTKMDGSSFVTSGGRVLNICAKGDTLADALKTINDAISFIKFENMYYRKDIGRK